MERSILVFEGSINSAATLRTYKFALNKFKNYYKLKDFDSIPKIELNQLQIMVEDFVFYLKRTVSPNSISTIMAGIEHFLTMNDVELRWKKIHKLYPAKVKAGGRSAYTTEDVQKMDESTKDPKGLALIHTLASTGARIGALPELKIRHMLSMDDNCKAILFYPGDKKEYWGFLTPEASLALEKYLNKRRVDGEYLTVESPLFRTKYALGSLKAKHTTTGALSSIVKNIVKKSVPRQKIGGRFDKPIDQAFRKRFNTTLKNNDNCNRSLTEKLMSHEVKDIPLDGTYHDPDVKTLFNEFKKHIINLTVNPNERKSIESAQKIAQKDKEISELKQERETNKQLQERLERVERQLAKQTRAEVYRKYNKRGLN